MANRGIRLKPMRRDIPASCALCKADVTLTARETRLVHTAQLSHRCGADGPPLIVQEPPERNVRGRFLLKPRP